MVFVGGPRQVGKTTLCRDFVAANFKSFAYFNWDNRADRKAIIAASWPGDAELLIFDEIHKYRQWKGFICVLWNLFQGLKYYLSRFKIYY